MPTPIAMPKLGMTMTEGMVVDWPLATGTAVAHGDVVLVIESDKSEIDVEATGNGTLHHIYVQPEEVVPCGTLLAVLIDDADADFDPDAFHAEWEREREKTDVGPATTETPTSEPAPSAPRRATGGAMTPAARKRARELGVEPSTLTGSGPGGRITREDVEAAAERREALSPASGGVALEVPRIGEGPEIFLLPGFGTDVSAFAAQSPTLATQFCVRGVNPRGVGASDAPEAQAYDIPTLAADVAALIDTPAHVAGTSLGSAIAIELAITYPEKVASLALLAPLVHVSSRLAAVAQAWCQTARSTTPDILAASLLPWFFGAKTLADDKRREQILRGLRSTLAKVSADTLDRTRVGLEQWSGSRQAELAQISAPTLVITAQDDLLTPNGERVAEEIPGARLLTIAGAGHAVGLEAPDEINQAMLEHFAAVAHP